MKLILILISFLNTVSISYAETYKWEDENGMHFTDNANSIPEQYRARVIEDARQRSGYYDRQTRGAEQRSIGDEAYGTSDRMRKHHAPIQPSRFDSTKSSIDHLFAPLVGGIAVLILIGLLAFVPLWLYALIDIIRGEFADPSNKILWIILLIFLTPLSLPLYYLIGRKQKKGWMSTEQAELAARLRQEQWKDGEFKVK